MWWIAATAALAVAAASLLYPGASPRRATLVVAGSRPTPDTTPVVRSHVTPAIATYVARSRPEHLRIASIDLTTRLGEVGLQANRQVMVPPSTAYASWFDLGPTPGQVGSAVILGHVDSYTGPGVFFRLKSLRVGARVEVTLADRTLATFAVTGVVQYSKNDFPDALVYGSRGFRALQLVTCGGAFDHATGHYESNIVVFTKLVHVTSPRPTLAATVS